MSFKGNYTLNTPVDALPGVGSVRSLQLAKLGICTLRDLVYFFPRNYENRGEVRLLGDLETDIPRSYILTVANEVKTSKINKKLTISKFHAFDESGTIEITFFNCPFVKDVFHTGDTFRFYGKTVFGKTRRLTMQNPKYETMQNNSALNDYYPIYRLTDGITSKSLDKLISKALDLVLSQISDPLPEAYRLKYSLPTLSSSLRNIHFPTDNSKLYQAQRRLAFDEMLLFGLGVASSAKKRTDNIGATFAPCSLAPLTALLPYELTSDQKSAINDIYKDTVFKGANGITSSMARIIVGDVGCGKTICAIAAIYIAALSGYQSALMVPTEILAVQHYEDIKNFLGKLGINCCLLTGSTTQSRKKQIYASLANGEIKVIVGTHALLSDKVEFENLGLIITDEQHRFGVAQRAVLKDRTKSAHMLVMSATPIPRTLALALYGDLDVSRITEMPKGRMRVETFVVNEEYRERLYGFIENQVSLGGQCYIVCPAIEKNEDAFDEYESGTIADEATTYLKNAVEYTEELKRIFPTIKIECLHGKMKNADKDAIMHSFAAGETKILVSTTVIEVGVNVPNASLMIVENAERFGLSQLHQLRGRVGRGTRRSYCILVSNSKGENSAERLEIMRTTYDGFEIAERDLLMRGPGDFFSNSSDDIFRQSGGFKFKIASTFNDAALFEQAFECAKSIIENDPKLQLSENKLLKEQLSFTISESTIS